MRAKATIIAVRAADAIMAGLFLGTAISMADHPTDIHRGALCFIVGYWLTRGLFTVLNKE